MEKNVKKNILIYFTIFIFIISFCIHRCHIIENEVYIKLLSESTYFIFSKHEASREIIKEYKRIKDNSFVQFVAEGAEYLLYKNETDVLRVIKSRNENLENILYEPNFSYEIDGKYVHFKFEDELLNYVDGIMMRLTLNVKNDEKDLYYIPVNTNVNKYESIIRIDKLEELDLRNLVFEIEYAHCF